MLHLAVGRQRPPQSADSRASVAEHPELILRIVARLGEGPHVELIERLFDLVEGMEIACDDPLQDRRDKRGRIEQADFALSFRNRTEVVKHGDLGTVGSQDPVRTKETIDHDPLTIRVALCVRDSNSRHPVCGQTPAMSQTPRARKPRDRRSEAVGGNGLGVRT